MNPPPVFLGVVGYKYYRPLVGFGFRDHVFPDNEIAEFVELPIVLLGVLVSRWDLLRIAILALFLHRSELLGLPLVTNSSVQKLCELSDGVGDFLNWVRRLRRDHPTAKISGEHI